MVRVDDTMQLFQNSSVNVSVEAVPVVRSDEPDPTPKKKIGLNPRMLESNKWVANARQAAGGHMTEAETARARLEYRQHWDLVGEDFGGFDAINDKVGEVGEAASDSEKEYLLG